MEKVATLASVVLGEQEGDLGNVRSDAQIQFVYGPLCVILLKLNTIKSIFIARHSKVYSCVYCNVQCSHQSH